MRTIVSQPLSGGSHKIRMQGQHMPKVFANLHVAFSLGAGESLERFVESHSMNDQLQPSLTSLSALHSVGCSGVKQTFCKTLWIGNGISIKFIYRLNQKRKYFGNLVYCRIS